MPSLAQVSRVLNRLAFRYVSAAGTLILSRSLLGTGDGPAYAEFALYISFASILTIADLGHGSGIVVGGGQRQRLINALTYTIALLLLFLGASAAVSAGGFLQGEGNHWSFALGALLLLPLYILGRHSYVVQGPEVYNLKSLRVYPTLIALLLIALLFDGLEPEIAAWAAALFIVFGPFVFGLRPRDFTAFKDYGSMCSSLRSGGFLWSGSNLFLLLIGIVGFIGAGSNVSFLFGHGTSTEVIYYDLVWRLASVTMFSQIILSHSLTKVVEIIEGNPSAVRRIYLGLIRKATMLGAGQAAVVALVWFPYQALYGVEVPVMVVISGMSMSLTFGLGIAGNHVLLATRQYCALLFSLAMSAFLATMAKVVLLDAGLSASEAFLSTTAGYALGALLLHFFCFSD